MPGIKVTEDVFGYLPVVQAPGGTDLSITSESNSSTTNITSKGILIRRLTMQNTAGMKVQVLNYGATISSISIPDKSGVVRDVVLGFDDIEGYLGAYGNNPYFGATVGRVANRIAKSTFILDKQVYNLTPNKGENHLHGGAKGFDKRVWESFVTPEGKVTFSYRSSDGEEGYPGEVLAQVTYQLSPENQLNIDFQALSTKPTPICLTNHSYFNLNGHENGDDGLKDHIVMLNASRYTPLNKDLIVTGEIKPVDGTVYDLQTPQNLSDLLKTFPEGPNGYDINLCVNQQQSDKELALVGSVSSNATNLKLSVYSNQPGVQFYTANFLPDPVKNEKPILGKGKAQYFKHGAFCLETQNYPNAINMPNFPNCVLNPGQRYIHRVVYHFKAC